jgi:hypothetical protein
MDLDSTGEYKENEGLIDAKVIGGYPSTPGNGDGALDDMTQYKFSLCEFCLDFLFTRFVVPPTVNCIGFAPPPYVCDGSLNDIVEKEQEPFYSAEERVKNDEWRRGKKEFFQRKIERDIARKIK